MVNTIHPKRLFTIYQNVSLMEQEDIEQIKSLISESPYYYVPYLVLAKYYYLKQDAQFEDFIQKAAIRVDDRKALYKYINNQLEPKENPTIKDIIQMDSSFSEPIKEVEEQNLIQDIHNQVVEDKNVLINDLIPNETEVETTVTPENLEIQEPEAIEEITTFEDSIEETIVLEHSLSEQQKEQPITDIYEFLADFVSKEEQEQYENTSESIEFEEKIEVLDTPIISESIENEAEQDLVELPIDDILNEDIKQEYVEAEVEFTFSKSFTTDAELETEELDSNQIENTETVQAEIESLETNQPLEKQYNLEELLSLRKQPIYSLEQAVLEHQSIENEEVSSEKDFFAWLKHPQKINSEPKKEDKVPTHDEKVDLIDRFISINPQISRPKKEFFSAENMAKKSEVLELDLVTETLAKIYEESGNINMAIKVYEKLILQNPSKKTYFANHIKKLKKESK